MHDILNRYRSITELKKQGNEKRLLTTVVVEIYIYISYYLPKVSNITQPYEQFTWHFSDH